MLTLRSKIGESPRVRVGVGDAFLPLTQLFGGLLWNPVVPTGTRLPTGSSVHETSTFRKCSVTQVGVGKRDFP